MTRQLSPAEARAYARRWKLVAETERAALRTTPMSRKFEQLAALMASARALGWQTTDAGEVEIVRARWVQLAERCRE